MPFAQSDGCSIHYEVEGPPDAPALILSNSIGTNLHMWDEQAPEFARRFRLVRYDRRGHGRSGVPNGPYTMDQLGRDALAVADAVGARKFNWCGLSMGGMVGQWLGANASERLERLVISNTHFYYEDKAPWNERIKLVREKGLGALADVMMERWFTAPFRAHAPEKVARIRSMFMATPRDGFIGCAQAVRDMDFRESNKRIAAPTLVIGADKDIATPPSWGEAIAKQIPGARFVSIPDASHLANIEQAGIYTELVLDFLLRRR
ncbi:MAG TPA: 3-oxoadipate enol-lactonase [Xanthobacteraceae bacterium]|nr:3-oxoadipate enol-lactonase [Xanthobacteraceae bacterium]